MTPAIHYSRSPTYSYVFPCRLIIIDARQARAWRGEMQTSVVARILWRRPRAGLSSLLSPATRARGRSAERRQVHPAVGGRASCDRRARHSALHRGFSVPGAVLPGGTGCLTRPAGSGFRRSVVPAIVQPFRAAGLGAGGRLARASRVCGVRCPTPAGSASPPAVTTPHENALSGGDEWQYSPIGIYAHLYT